MKARAKELKAEARTSKSRAEGERAVLSAIAEMSEPDRAMAERLHAIITASAPALAPKTWYGMPAYAKDGKVICFFQAASKFKVRYATFGFQPDANLDDGAMWPTSFALVELTAAEEATDHLAREESGELRVEIATGPGRGGSGGWGGTFLRDEDARHRVVNSISPGSPRACAAANQGPNAALSRFRTSWVNATIRR